MLVAALANSASCSTIISTACALWLIVQTKLSWAADMARDPRLAHQMEVEFLSALSMANVREMLKSI
jgi:hypothetical protein